MENAGRGKEDIADALTGFGVVALTGHGDVAIESDTLAMACSTASYASVPRL